VIWSTLGKAIYWTIGGIQAVGELVGSGRRLVRQMRKGIVPMVDDTQPIPLTPERAAARRAGGSIPGGSDRSRASDRPRP